MQIDWVNSLLLFGVLQGVLLALALGLMTSQSKGANRVLALLILVFSFDLFMEVVYNSSWYHRWPFLIGLETPLQFLYGPLLLLYTRLLIGHPSVSLRTFIWNFLPTFFMVILWSGFYFSASADKIEHIDQLIANSSVDSETLVYWVILLVHVMVYSTIVLQLILNMQSSLKDHYSALEKVNLSWLLVLVGAIVVSWLAAATQVCVIASGISIDNQWLMLPTVSIVLTIYLIGYTGFSKPKIFTGENASPINGEVSKRESTESHHHTDTRTESSRIIDNQSEAATRDKKSSFQLSAERIELLERKLNQLIEQQQIFLNPELRLRTLSETLEVPEHHLTILFNEHYGVKFYDFINQRRIKFAKQLLASSERQNKSVLEIGFAAGFNSKSTFYSLFKKATDQTPAQYRKKKENHI